MNESSPYHIFLVELGAKHYVRNMVAVVSIIIIITMSCYLDTGSKLFPMFLELGKETNHAYHNLRKCSPNPLCWYFPQSTLNLFS